MNCRLLALFAIFLPVAALAAVPQARQPTGKWVINFADDMCTLERSYGAPDHPILLAMSPSPTGNNYVVIVFTPRSGTSATVLPARIGLGPSSANIEARLATFDVREKNLRYNSVNLKRQELERAAASNFISIEAGRELNIAFHVSELGRALEILDECVVDLLAHWGFSRERQASMTTPPQLVGDYLDYVRSQDYPSQAGREGQMGINSARFSVRSDGSTSNCTLVQSSGSRSLDTMLCRVVGRFRFRPAVDKDGQPMDSLSFIRINWFLR